MEKIYIGFSYHKGSWLSSLIKWVEGTPYSHVYIRKKSRYGEYIYQASGLQVNFMNVDIFLESNVIVEEYEFELEEDKRDDVIAFFIKYAGAKYQTAALFEIFWIIIARRFGHYPRFEGTGYKSFTCSKLGSFFCEDILMIDIPGTNDYVTPSDFNPIVKLYGKRVI